MSGLRNGLAAGLLLIFAASASDQDANTIFSSGRDREKAESYRRAAARYMDAHLMADSSVLRGNALIAAARAYRKAELYGEEFDCLQRLIAEHLSEIDFMQVVDREYRIGDLFFAGHRDLVVSWIPFIREKDRTVEIYEAVLKNAPCHKQAGVTRLRLSRIYIDDQQPDKAIPHLREIPKLQPGTPAAKYAMLEVCSLLYQMAERGDGDGSYSRQTIEACDKYLEAYPDSKEVPWVMTTRQKARNGIAARIHSVGYFYYRSGKPELAEKYLAEVVRNYPNTETAAASENLLARIDEEFEVPPGQAHRYRPYKEKIPIAKVPEEDEPIIISPENSGGRWLLPIRDLRRSVAVNAKGLTPDEYDRFKAESDQLKEQKEQDEDLAEQNQALKDRAAGRKPKPSKRKNQSDGDAPQKQK
ncbi:MAG: outer membrane protein assembly factor BamD [Lentisphaeria bacterium]|nr:outer membrane protein assembly factor BamD [Lentisphaeria bacterium]